MPDPDVPATVGPNGQVIRRQVHELLEVDATVKQMVTWFFSGKNIGVRYTVERQVQTKICACTWIVLVALRKGHYVKTFGEKGQTKGAQGARARSKACTNQHS